MDFQRNANGVPQFPKGDARRLFVLLAAINTLKNPTISMLAEYTGHNKGTIAADVAKLVEQFGVGITLEGRVFQIENWGDLLRKKRVLQFLPGFG